MPAAVYDAFCVHRGGCAVFKLKEDCIGIHPCASKYKQVAAPQLVPTSILVLLFRIPGAATVASNRSRYHLLDRLSRLQ